MTWFFLPILIVLALLAYVGGRALAVRRAQGAAAHSRPGHHGLYALIWVAVPALTVLLAAGAFQGQVSQRLVAAGAPAEVTALEPFRREAFFATARRPTTG